MCSVTNSLWALVPSRIDWVTVSCVYAVPSVSAREPPARSWRVVPCSEDTWEEAHICNDNRRKTSVFLPQCRYGKVSIPETETHVLKETAVAWSVSGLICFSSVLKCPSSAASPGCVCIFILFLLHLCAVCLVAQLCPSLCNPMDWSPPGSSVHGILQGESWSGLPCPSPGDLPNPCLPHCRQILYQLRYQGSL